MAMRRTGSRSIPPTLSDLARARPSSAALGVLRAVALKDSVAADYLGDPFAIELGRHDKGRQDLGAADVGSSPDRELLELVEAMVYRDRPVDQGRAPIRRAEQACRGSFGGGHMIII